MDTNDILITWSWDLPDSINRPTVVIDADAATTNIAHMIASGVDTLILVDEHTIQQAKDDYEGETVIGEGRGYPTGFFDATNEAAVVNHTDVYGKTVLFMSNNGTHVIEQAIQRNASPVYAGSFANMEALVHHIRAAKHKKLIIIASGEKNFEDPRAPEDWICAELIGELLTGQIDTTPQAIIRAKDFIRSHYHHKNMEEDVELVFQFNRYNVVPVCETDEKYIRVRNAEK